MVREKRHFLEYDFPNAGIFYADTCCKVPLFIGQLEIYENKIRIKVLERQKDGYGGTLYAHLRTSSNHHNIVSWSFFDCHFDSMHNYVEFSSFVRYDNQNTRGWENKQRDNLLDKIPIPKFVTQNDKFKRISVMIESLDMWLWKQPLEAMLEEDFQFGVQFVDKKGEKHRGYRIACKNGAYEFDKNITCMMIPAHTIKEKIDLNEELSLELHSTPEEFGVYPDFEIWQNCYIDIISKVPKSMKYFYYVIYCLSVYFTSIGFRKCKIHKIHYCEPVKFLKDDKIKPLKLLDFYHNGLCWDIMKKKYDEWFTREKLKYHSLQKDFGSSFRLFFEKQDSLHNIINFLTDMDDRYNKGYLEIYITQQIQLLETYGNLKLKGEYIKGKDGRIRPSENLQDLMKVMELLPDEIFGKIFLHNYHNIHYQGGSILGYENRNKPINELKKILLLAMTELRNFIVHPYKNGQHKELKNTRLPQWYCLGDRLDMQVISSLSHCLNMVLRWFLFEEIGLGKYFEA